MKPNRYKVLDTGLTRSMYLHVESLRMPGARDHVLSAWCAAFSQQLCEAGAVIIPIIQM